MQKRFDYALFLVGRLKDNGVAFTGIRSVAAASGLPGAYLEKVAQELKRAGWLESRKGSGGGYRLVEEQKDISVGALIRLYSPIQKFCPLLRALNK